MVFYLYTSMYALPSWLLPPNFDCSVPGCMGYTVPSLNSYQSSTKAYLEYPMGKSHWLKSSSIISTSFLFFWSYFFPFFPFLLVSSNLGLFLFFSYSSASFCSSDIWFFISNFFFLTSVGWFAYYEESTFSRCQLPSFKSSLIYAK